MRSFSGLDYKVNVGDRFLEFYGERRLLNHEITEMFSVLFFFFFSFYIIMAVIPEASKKSKLFRYKKLLKVYQRVSCFEIRKKNIYKNLNNFLSKMQ